MELLRMDLGVKLVPAELALQHGDWKKRPVGFLSPNRRTRKPGDPNFAVTDDPLVWQQWCAVCPDALMGIMPCERFVVVDDDRGDFDATTVGLAGTYADRSPRPGVHYWSELPPGRTARNARLPGGGGDIITGDRYVVSSPSAGYAAIDVDAPILTLPESSLLWQLVRPQRTSMPVEIPALTPVHQHQAAIVIASLLGTRADIAQDARQLLAGKVPLGATRSEADYCLALMASYWTRDPAVIAAVLWQSGLVRPKWRRNDYLPRTISRVLSRREELAAHAQALPCELWDTLPPEGSRTSVSEVLMLGLEQIGSGEFARVPVQHLADRCHVNRRTITRTIDRLARCGAIETHFTTEHVSGNPVRTRWARLPASIQGTE